MVYSFVVINHNPLALVTIRNETCSSDDGGIDAGDILVVIQKMRYFVDFAFIIFSILFQVYSYTTMSGLDYDSSAKNCTCFKSYTHRHEATSPAFDQKDYSSTKYSTWTESK